MARQPNVISHWYQLIENFQTSPLGFYEAVEAAIQRRGVPDLQTSRVDFKEGGVLTAKREYLHIVRGQHTFDICGAPFGTGFFFSWWLTETPPNVLGAMIGLFLSTLILLYLFFQAGVLGGIALAVIVMPAAYIIAGFAIRESGNAALEETVLAIPLIGRLYYLIFNPPTFYKIDTALMYQTAVHNAVLEVIDQLTTANGYRTLSELERKPVLKAFAKSA